MFPRKPDIINQILGESGMEIPLEQGLVLRGNHYAKDSDFLGDAHDSWDLVNSDGAHVGEFFIGLETEGPRKIPFIRQALINKAYRGHGFGRVAMKALIKYYGTLRSDPMGSTSDEAEKAWKSLGAKKLSSRVRPALHRSDFVLGRHQVDS